MGVPYLTLSLRPLCLCCAMGGVSYCCFATPNKNIMHIIRKVPNVVKNNNSFRIILYCYFATPKRKIIRIIRKVDNVVIKK